LEAVNRILVASCEKNGLETGETVRGDTTVVDANIHPPTDSGLLWDVVRVLTRTLARAGRLFKIPFTDRSAETKALHVRLTYVAKPNRPPLYRRLVRSVEATLLDATRAVGALAHRVKHAKAAGKLARRLTHFVESGRRVLDQTRRRVFRGEVVPSLEKLVSVFEPHASIIVKNRGRSVHFGHKVALVSGRSGLVLDCTVEEGNPADLSLTPRLIDRQIRLFGRPPRRLVLDGGFASNDNFAYARRRGVRDVVFTKGKGLTIAQMVKSGSERIYRELVRFRAGIEAVISTLKRAFGLERCTWRGREGLRAYIWGGVLAANLALLARTTIG
jgi:IS5 family transposase